MNMRYMSVMNIMTRMSMMNVNINYVISSSNLLKKVWFLFHCMMLEEGLDTQEL